MPQELQLQILPEIAGTSILLKEAVSKQLQVNGRDIQHISILKRSIDARQKQVKVNLKVLVFFQGEEITPQKIDFPQYKDVSNGTPVLVIGAGPAGYFSALQLI